MSTLTYDKTKNAIVLVDEGSATEVYFKDIDNKEQVKFALKRELAEIIDRVKAFKERADEIKLILDKIKEEEAQ